MRYRAVLNKSAPFISFTIGGSSINEAKECLNSVINDIRVKQDQLSEPILLQKRVHLKTLEDKLVQADNAVKLFSGIQPSNLNFKDEKFSASSLVLATKMASEGSVKDLTNQIEDMKISLLPPLTQPTNLAIFLASLRAKFLSLVLSDCRNIADDQGCIESQFLENLRWKHQTPHWLA